MYTRMELKADSSGSATGMTAWEPLAPGGTGTARLRSGRGGQEKLKSRQAAHEPTRAAGERGGRPGGRSTKMQQQQMRHVHASSAPRYRVGTAWLGRGGGGSVKEGAARPRNEGQYTGQQRRGGDWWGKRRPHRRVAP
jgi:hypothetical protein